MVSLSYFSFLHLFLCLCHAGDEVAHDFPLGIPW